MKTHPDMILDSDGKIAKDILAYNLNLTKPNITTELCYCRLCKQPMPQLTRPVLVDDTLYYKDNLAVLTPTLGAIAACLCEAFGRPVKTRYLYNELYLLNDGPESANIISIYIHHLRKKLSQFIPELEIVTKPWHGYTLKAKD